MSQDLGVLEDEREEVNELTIGLASHTNSGLISSLLLKYSYQIDRKNYRFGQFEIANVKNEREERFTSSNSSNSFILGKIKYLIPIRLSYGHERTLFEKFPENGVRIHYTYSAGPSIGVVKPYYIEYPFSDSLQGTQIVAYDPDIHSLNQIRGDAGMFTGFTSGTINPGAHGRMSLNCEYGRNSNLLLGVEAGMVSEIYLFKNIVNINQEAKRFYNSLFLHFYYGISF